MTVPDATERLVMQKLRLEEFALRILNPEDFGYSVTPEVRVAAKNALGIFEPTATLASQSNEESEA